MSKAYKVLFSVLAVVLSLIATGLGCNLATSLGMNLRLVHNFVFITQSVATSWIAISLFWDGNKK